MGEPSSAQALQTSPEDVGAAKVNRCTMCNFSSRDKQGLMRHLKYHNSYSNHRCLLCSFSVMRASHLTRHMNQHHSNKNIKKIESHQEELKEPSSRSKNEEEQLKSLLENVEKVFHCPECDFNCKSNYKLRNHQKFHLNKSSHKCPKCSYSVGTLSHLHRHLKEHHLNQVEVETDQVLFGEQAESDEEMDYESSDDLHDDMDSEYNEVNITNHNHLLLLKDDGMDFIDEDDEINSASLNDLPNKGKDKSTKLFYCPYCKFTAKDKRGFKRHESYHHVKSRFQCPHCSFSVNLRRHVTRHINSNHEKLRQNSTSLGDILDEEEEEESINTDEEEERAAINLFYCPVCEFVGSHLTSIRRHEVCHRKKSKFQCPHCSFSVGCPSHLGRHIKWHHRLKLKDGECSPSTRLLNCGKCDYSTDDLPNLRRHERLHRVKASCQCPHCSYSVGTAWHLSRHVTYDHHSIKDDEVEEITQKPSKKPKFTNLTRKFRCEFCDFSSDRADSFKHHILGHIRNLKFKCSLCNFTADFSKTIAFHVGHHHREPSKSSNMRESYAPLRDMFSHINQPEATRLSNAKSWLEVKEIEVETMKKTIRSSIRKIEKIHSSENQVLISKIYGLKEELKLNSSKKNGLTKMIGELLSKKSSVELRLLKMRAEVLNVGLGEGAQMMEEKVLFLKEELKGIEKGLERLSEEENGLIKDSEDVRSSLNALEVDLKSRNSLNEMIDSTQMKIVDGFQLENGLAKIRLLESRSGSRQRRDSLLEMLRNVVEDDSDDC